MSKIHTHKCLFFLKLNPKDFDFLFIFYKLIYFNHTLLLYSLQITVLFLIMLKCFHKTYFPGGIKTFKREILMFINHFGTSSVG